MQNKLIKSFKKDLHNSPIIAKIKRLIKQREEGLDGWTFKME